MRWFLLLIFSLCIALPASAQPIDVPEEFKLGVVVVGPNNLPPMCFAGMNREPKGYLPDYWRLWSKKTGVPVSFELMSWRETIERMQAGGPYIHAGLYKTPVREEFLEYAKKIHGVGVVLYSPRGSSVHGIKTLGRQVVAVLHKGAAEEMLKKDYPNTNFKAYTSYEAMLDGYLEGETDALLSDDDIVVYTLGKKGVLEAHVKREQLWNRKLYAAVPQGNSTLHTLVNDGMSLIDEEELSQIIDRWYVTDTSISQSLKIGLGVSIVVLLGGLLYVLFGGRKHHFSD